MSTKPAKILMPNGDVHVSKVPKPKAVHPFGSKILVSVLRGDEILSSNSVLVSESTKVDGAPQAYIIELGPTVAPDSGLAVGQRVYWTGRGTEIADPREESGRVRAILEISNIIGIIDEV